MLVDCWDRKGAEYGNQSGQTIRWANKNVEEWLRRWNPEAAILMFGTNDLNNVDVDDYEKHSKRSCVAAWPTARW